jgi:hypothetical protein
MPMSSRPTEQKTSPIMTTPAMMKTLENHERTGRDVVWFAKQFSGQPLAARNAGGAL